MRKLFLIILPVVFLLAFAAAFYIQAPSASACDCPNGWYTLSECEQNCGVGECGLLWGCCWVCL